MNFIQYFIIQIINIESCSLISKTNHYLQNRIVLLYVPMKFLKTLAGKLNVIFVM